jgi:hypothetical protein
MSLNKYTLKVSRPEYWREVHDLLCRANTIETHIPDRAVECCNEMEHSPVRGTFELSDEEAATLAEDYRIAWIELSPSDYRDNYPVPQPATGLPPEARFETNVKFYRTLTGIGYTDGERNRSNYGVRRTGLTTSNIFTVGSQLARTDNVDYVYDGSNVDIIVQDSGILRSHPEFLREDGTSRVYDLIIDGPYEIDPTFFVTNNLTRLRPDGTTGITTQAAVSWWNYTYYRSPQYASAGTVAVNFNYNEYRGVGVGTGTLSALGSGHGTAAASVAAGKNFGLAFRSNIWNMPCVGESSLLYAPSIEQAYDLMKIFHQNKPVNNTLGVKKPTVINGSWGYQAAARQFQSHYTRFRQDGNGGVQFTYMNGYNSLPADARTMVYGFNNQVSGAYRSWSSSSRSNSTDQAGKELMDAGVIYVSAAGNNDQYVGVGSTNPHRFNGCQDLWFNSNDPRTEFTGGFPMCPTSHRDWMNPQGIGFDASVDPEFHPVINVGALDDYPQWSGSIGIEEQKAYYSNKGDGIDVYAPADDMLAAGSPPSGYQDYLRWNVFAEFGANFYDAYFNGTSAAAPVVAGLVACYMQRFPTADARQVKTWLKTTGSGSQEPGTTFWDPYQDGFFYNDYSGYGDQWYLWWTYNRAMNHVVGSTWNGVQDKTFNHPIRIAYLNPQVAISTEASAINTPGISTLNIPERGVFNVGVALTSEPYAPNPRVSEVGTLKKVHFQVSPTQDFSTIAWETATDNVNLTQETGALSQATDYYYRVRHISNPDGTAFTSYVSEYSGIQSFRTYNPPSGVSTPEVLEPTNGQSLINIQGIRLRSKAYSPINGELTSGTLKAVEFQVATDAAFTLHVFSTVGLNNTNLFQTITETLEYGQTYYARVRHVSNSDGSSQIETTSEWSPTSTFFTPSLDPNPFGRSKSLITTLQNGVVTPVLLLEASELIEASITASNTTNNNTAFSIGISSSFGFVDSDYISYGIDLPRGGNEIVENVALKPGDKIFVSSFDPGVDFSAFTTRFFKNVKAESAAVHGRSKSLTSSLNPPFTINDNLPILDATENSLATVHATNRNPDVSASISVGIASGDITTAQPADYIVHGLRVAPLQDFKIDNVGVATGQTLFVRASKSDVSFVAYSIPSDAGATGVGTVGDVNTTGVITATKFVGDGSGLTGVTAIGAGVEVRDSGSTVGAASTIDFGARLTVSAISAGIVTITASDTVGIAETANSLADGVTVGLALTATDATNAINAQTAQYAITAGLSTVSLSAAVASGIRSDAEIFTTRAIETTDKFIGDGSLLTNVVAVGSGVVIENSGSLVGTAQTINLDLSLDVSPVSAGFVTVTVQKVPHADIAGVATYASIAGVSSFCPNAGFATASTNASFAAFANFSALTGAAETSKSLYTESDLPYKPLPVTIGAKSSRHRYIGVGSDRTINIQGYEAPYMRFEVGQTYRFENAAQQANFPIRFYYAADGLGVGFGTTSPSVYTDRVTETGTYTEIQVTEETPQLLYYGAGIGTTMGNMGNSIQVFNHEFHKFLRVGEYKNLAGLKTCTHTQMFEGRATAWYMNTNLGVGNSDYVPGDRSHNISSIEQVSTGVYNINFADAMNDSNYAVVINGRGINNFPGGLVRGTVFDRTTTGFGVTIYNSIPATEDLKDVNIVVYGGQDGEPTYL